MNHLGDNRNYLNKKIDKNSCGNTRILKFRSLQRVNIVDRLKESTLAEEYRSSKIIVLLGHVLFTGYRYVFYRYHGNADVIVGHRYEVVR